MILYNNYFLYKKMRIIYYKDIYKWDKINGLQNIYIWWLLFTKIEVMVQINSNRSIMPHKNRKKVQRFEEALPDSRLFKILQELCRVENSGRLSLDPSDQGHKSPGVLPGPRSGHHNPCLRPSEDSIDQVLKASMIPQLVPPRTSYKALTQSEIPGGSHLFRVQGWR